MLLDKEGQLSAVQAVTVTAKSTNTIDQGPPGGPNAVAGSDSPQMPELVFTIQETFTAGGAATLTIQLRSSANSDMSSPVVHESSETYALAALTAGARLSYRPRIPMGSRRYVDVNYVVATGPMTAGKISCDQATARQTAFRA
jgi:hypothetical protein